MIMNETAPGKLLHRLFIGVEPVINPLPDPVVDIWIFEDGKKAITEDNKYLNLE
jgi:hypothetical protein